MPEIFIADEKRTKTLLDRLKNNSLKVKTFDINTIDIQNNKNIILLNINSEIYSSLNLEDNTIIKMTPRSYNQLLSENELKEKLYDLFLKLKVQRNQYVGIPYLIDSIICCYYDKSLFSKGLIAIYKKVEKKYDYKINCNHIFWKINDFFRSYNNSLNIYNVPKVFPSCDKHKTLSAKYFISLSIQYLKAT